MKSIAAFIRAGAPVSCGRGRLRTFIGADTGRRLRHRWPLSRMHAVALRDGARPLRKHHSSQAPEVLMFSGTDDRFWSRTSGLCCVGRDGLAAAALILDNRLLKILGLGCVFF